MDPVLKSLLNSLKCPICGAQIEGTSGKFYCVSDPDDYVIIMDDEDSPLLVMKEMVRLDHNQHRYVIVQSPDSTAIGVWKIDVEGRVVIEKGRLSPNPLEYPGKLFDFSQCTKKQILNRVKTLLVFQ